jgi:O-methyltransferase
MSDAAIYASPRQVHSLEDCFYYHSMEIPGQGVMSGLWDLRAGVDDYLGQISLAGKRVLEIGPASGFLTVEMEKRGADIVAVEIMDDPGWDFVPFPPAVMDAVYGPRREVMRRLKNSFWFTHAAYRLKAKLYYGDAYNLPDQLGHFDVAVMGSVLLHCRCPVGIVEQCARKANTIVITDLLTPELEGQPVCRLIPTRENREWGTWWHFSTTFFLQFFGVLGFTETKVTTHAQWYETEKASVPLFTIVASKPPAQSLCENGVRPLGTQGV